MIEQLLNRFQQPLSIGIVAICIGWAIYLIVQNVFFYLDAQVAVELDQVAQAPATSRNPARSTRIQDTTLSLFGRTNDTPKAVVVEAPQTRLNLELEGVFLSAANEVSSAIVAERGRDGKLYNVGDKLPGNSVLHSVAADHILLKRSGRLEKLMFVTKRLGIETASGNRRGSSSAVKPQRTLASARPTNPRATSSTTSQRSSGDAIADFRNRLATNPKSVLDEYGLKAVAPGTSQGYKVESAHPALRNSGLQPGDRVVSVNGAPLGVAMNDARLVDQARSAGRVRVEVERGGRRFFLTIPIP